MENNNAGSRYDQAVRTLFQELGSGEKQDIKSIDAAFGRLGIRVQDYDVEETPQGGKDVWYHAPYFNMDMNHIESFLPSHSNSVSFRKGFFDSGKGAKKSLGKKEKSGMEVCGKDDEEWEPSVRFVDNLPAEVPQIEFISDLVFRLAEATGPCELQLEEAERIFDEDFSSSDDPDAGCPPGALELVLPYNAGTLTICGSTLDGTGTYPLCGSELRTVAWSLEESVNRRSPDPPRNGVVWRMSASEQPLGAPPLRLGYLPGPLLTSPDTNLTVGAWKLIYRRWTNHNPGYGLSRKTAKRLLFGK